MIHGGTVNGRLGEGRCINIVYVLLGLSDRELFESRVCIYLINCINCIKLINIRLGAKFISEVHFTLSYISS